MDSLQSLKSRSKAVKNVGQITKAMEVVAATKMRKAQEVALRSRPYAYRALELLARVTEHESFASELTTSRPVKTTAILIVASDKGLTGAFNTQVFRAADSFFATDSLRGNLERPYIAITVGKKATQYALKNKLHVGKDFSGFGDHALPEEINPLARSLIEGYTKKQWDRVVTLSTHFRTALKQETLMRQILPIDIDKIKDTVREIVPAHGRYADASNIATHENGADYLFEPSPKEVFDSLLPHLLTMQIYHLILEANASEHSARRVAMKTASDNAQELLDALTLEYNKARQAGITKELIEITSTQQALR